jgi:tripartite-type tricarboxylate transporter receptor subunit TctC
MKIRFAVVIGMLFLAWVIPCQGAEVKYPTQPIRMWVGFAAGGSTDVCGRAIANISEKVLGQPFIVENKPGAGGALVLGLLTSAPPDGYTLGMTSDTPFTRSPHLVTVKYNAMQDFIPIIRLGLQRQGVVVRADSPFKTFKELIEYARRNPGQLTYGSPGAGTSPHIAMEKIAMHEKVKFQHVPFQGDTPAMTAILGGHIMFASTGALSWMSHVKAGSLRLLLVYNPEGVDEFPDVPTFKKLGYPFVMDTAQMISVPKNVPKPIVDRLIKVFSEAMMTPEFQKVARDQELISAKPMVGEEFKKWLQGQYLDHGKWIKEIGLQKKE